MRLLVVTAWTCVALLLASATAEAQYFRFGLNRVQYGVPEWHVLTTPHFDVLYPGPASEALARRTGEAAEEALVAVSDLFAHHLSARVPIVVYPSHADFAVTNVAQLPPFAEGIGGVTERSRNRIALPFMGDERAFRRTLHHEIVHALTNDFYFAAPSQRLLRGGSRLRLPLWFAEGLAEFSALGWDTEADAMLRDAVVHDRLPDVPYLRGMLAYQGGQGVFAFLEAQYGRETITALIHRTRALGSVEAAFEEVVGMGLRAFSVQWRQALRAVYFPEVAAREDLAALARPIAGGATEGWFHAAAALTPAGDRVAFLATRDGLFDVFVAETTGDGPPQRLIRGQTSPAFESFPVLTPGLAWSPDGQQLAVAVKTGPDAAVALVHVAGNRTRHLRLPELDAVLAVAWSPDGTRLALSATAGGQSDLYLVDLATGASERLTDDPHSALEPVFAPDGRSLVFHADREPGAGFGLYRLALRGGGAERLTPPAPWDDLGAAFGGDGETLVFRSDRAGVANLYALDLRTGEVRPLTDVLTGFSRVSLSADGRVAATVALDDGVPAVWILREPLGRTITEPAPTVLAQQRGAPGTAPALAIAHPTTRAGNPFLWEAGLAGNPSADTSVVASSSAVPPRDEPFLAQRYRLRFAPDLVYGDLGYDTLYGVQSLVQVAVSDLLGDHRLVAATNAVVDLRNADYMVSYEALGGRTDVSLTGFHLARQLTDFDRQAVFRYRSYGLIAAASYPLDKFRRVEGELSLQGVSLANLVDPRLRARERVFLHPAVSYTVEATRPRPGGPGSGHRYAARVSGSPGLGGVTFLSGLGDGRLYRPLGRGTAAVRLAAGASVGPQPQRYFSAGVQNWLNPAIERLPVRDENDFVFGTPVLPLRGFAYDALSGSRFALLNLEWRLPIADAVRGPLLPLFYLEGVAFSDVAALPVRPGEASPPGLTTGLFQGVGVGLRALALGVPLRLDWAWPFDGAFHEPRLHLSVGLDF